MTTMPTNHTLCPHPSKKAYVNRDQAENALHKEWREGRRKHLPIRTYHCECGYWHTTSKPYKWWLDTTA